ncbi:Hydrogenase maturation factor HoxQ [Marinobacterium lacunae]|uniref:Hydrogenase maturation factor HoxQ n=1 Tax=Marinobacterium lacunae TaxID=1232683 RepID=A0A081G4G6_9GAMM|nr:hydrogenase expression/formation protein [Marinobacterium lacunae]KEA65671.1 Hydrogenase maturation factor HoxQ [Marinobacterium lacunae]MBR9882732.1 hydrogenase expression/formation protein [Oceanospirillales bacterium]
MKSDIPLFDLTPAIGPGSRSEEDTLSYMPMPKEMHTFELPRLPESDEIADAPEVLALLGQVQDALDEYRPGMPSRMLPLDPVGERGCALLYQVLGEGEVALQIGGDIRVRAQETVLAGLWWIQQVGADGHVARQWLEVADLPELVRRKAFADSAVPEVIESDLPSDIVNAAPVLVELFDVARAHRTTPLEPAHVINLSLLPFTPQDHAFLTEQLGRGIVTILSRGYGNCRIGSTAVPAVWRVQYFNSTDQLILDTLEVTDVPQVACAAREDLEDSAERLREMREVLA